MKVNGKGMICKMEWKCMKMIEVGEWGGENMVAGVVLDVMKRGVGMNKRKKVMI